MTGVTRKDLRARFCPPKMRTLLVTVVTVLVFLPAGWTGTWGHAQADLINPAMIASNIASKLLWRIVLEVGLLEYGTNQSNPFNLDQNLRTLQQIKELSNELRTSHITMTEILGRRMQDVVEDVSNRNRFIDRLERLYAIVRLIERRETKMNALLNVDAGYETLTLSQFAEATIDVSRTNSVIELLDELEMIVTGSNVVLVSSGQRDIFAQLNVAASSVICSFGLSPQQMIYMLYESIAMTELKGYIMMQFSYALLKVQGKGNFTEESQARSNELNTRLARTQQLMQSVMRQTSGEYWRCDPERGTHRENTTYVQFTRLLQGYIENEVDMNTDNTCRETCDHYQYGHEQQQCYKELYCSKQPKCAGRIYDCEYIDSDMWICPAAPGSQRRYEYIEYENGEIRGRKQHCPRGTSKVDSWWRWLFWHCSYCFCLCDDAGRHSDRYVSLRESVSDIEQNRVVTGLRFVKRKQMLHLIVQQGQLLPGGDIANDTLEWVVPKPFSHTDKGVRDGRDYHTLSYDRRAIDLDDVHVHPGYVLTGVRFRTLGSHLNLEIRMTEMNFTSGTLVDIDQSIWIGNEDADRTEIPLRYMDVPTLAPARSTPDSTSGQYLRFGPSGGRADAAQTTIPFLDAQPVYTLRPTPLAGAGLMHKGTPKYGGFVAPKVFTYDFGPHIQVPTKEWLKEEVGRMSNRSIN
ncbi:uncharacterized protein LOC118510803 isoform X1 [Anopheles stephensi]|uniref:uncharacterized protein LOC118510803 isoform X1 n=1 Tax=Anopheles stephensi TaxID=30069 RepID=UPI001658A465|nr:uncharacterized protein LOC118510803 isoform X1 [Anopheles stephensi]